MLVPVEHFLASAVIPSRSGESRGNPRGQHVFLDAYKMKLFLQYIFQSGLALLGMIQKNAHNNGLKQIVYSHLVSFTISKVAGMYVSVDSWLVASHLESSATKCDWVRHNIVFYAYKDLENHVRYEVEEHLGRCSDCAKELKLARRFHAALSSMPVEKPTPNILAASRMRLREALERAKPTAKICSSLVHPQPLPPRVGNVNCWSKIRLNLITDPPSSASSDPIATSSDLADQKSHATEIYLSPSGEKS